VKNVLCGPHFDKTTMRAAGRLERCSWLLHVSISQVCRFFAHASARGNWVRRNRTQQVTGSRFHPILSVCKYADSCFLWHSKRIGLRTKLTARRQVIIATRVYGTGDMLHHLNLGTLSKGFSPMHSNSSLGSTASNTRQPSKQSEWGFLCGRTKALLKLMTCA
jgi:hypothetical protein